MSLRNIALLNLSLCGLLALTGCKSPSALRFAERTAPEATSQFAAAEAEQPADRGGEQAAEAAESSSFTKSFRKATRWLAYRRPGSDSTQQVSPAEPSPAEQSLDRRWAANVFSPRGNSNTNTMIRPGTAAYPTTTERPEVAASHDNATTSTPSLVRRSRRPPPDPAPKPPQEQLLAAHPVVQNPYVNVTSSGTPNAPFHTPMARKTLFDTIESASRSWRMTPSQDNLVLTEASSKTAPGASDLKFSPPNIERRRAPSQVTQSAFAGGAVPVAQSAATHDSSARDPALQQRSIYQRSQSIPRRADLLRKQTPLAKSLVTGNSVAEDDSADAAQSRDTQSPVRVPSAQWVAKRTVPATQNQVAKEQVAKEQVPADRDPAANTSAVAKNVVAEAFANRTFAARQPYWPAAQDVGSKATGARNPVAQQHQSEFPLSQPTYHGPTSLGSSLPGSPVVVNSQTLQDQDAPLSAQPVANRPLSTSPFTKQDSPAPTSANRSNPVTVEPTNRIVTSPDTPVVGRSTAGQRREMVLQPPSPSAQTSGSFYSYYRKGPLPGAISLASRPSSALPPSEHASREASAASRVTWADSASAQVVPGEPPAETCAPLIDADVYRQQLAQQQRDRVTTQTTATQTAQQRVVPGTWMATYQKLVQDAGQEQRAAPVTSPGSTRSLSSQDAPAP